MENLSALKDAKTAFIVLRNLFMSEEVDDEKIIVFATIIKNQSVKMGVEWKTLLKQYKRLSSEIYTGLKFKNNGMDFFERMQKYIESGRKIL